MAGTQKAPSRNLIRVSGGRNLVVSLEAFGPNTYKENIAEMQNQCL